MSRRRKGPAEVKADWSWFEIAMGKDGFARGDPDPVLLLALYRITGDKTAGHKAELVCRGLSRVRVPSPYPASVDNPGEKPALARLLPGGESNVGLIAIALEEDGASDVRRVYAMFEQGDFTLWSNEHAEPEPLGLAEWIESRPEGVSSNVELLAAGESLAAGCQDDQLIGVCVSTFGTRALKARRRISSRFHFRSADGLNDWTTEVVVRL